MSLPIGSIAPDFDADTTCGALRFHDWIGEDWVFLFSHPADFTPVCTTEMGRTADLADEFAYRHVKPIALSTDTVDSHDRWIHDVNATQRTELQFPIIADPTLAISRRYGMIHDAQSTTETVRSVFIVDPQRIIRLTMTYPMSVGRNFTEILRVIDALQAIDRYDVATPADWHPGDRVIIPPSVRDDEARVRFPQGWEELRPYLRLVRL